MDEEKRAQSHELETGSSSLCVSSASTTTTITDGTSSINNIPVIWADEPSRNGIVSSMTRFYCAPDKSDKNGCSGESLRGLSFGSKTENSAQAFTHNKFNSSDADNTNASSKTTIGTPVYEEDPSKKFSQPCKHDISNLDALNLNESIFLKDNETEEGPEYHRHERNSSQKSNESALCIDTNNISSTGLNSVSCCAKHNGDMSVVFTGHGSGTFNGSENNCCTSNHRVVGSTCNLSKVNGSLRIPSDVKRIHALTQGFLLREGNNNEKVNERSDYSSSSQSSVVSDRAVVVTSESDSNLTKEKAPCKVPVLTGYLNSWKRSRYLSGNFSVSGDTMEGIVQCLVFLKAFSVCSLNYFLWFCYCTMCLSKFH